MNEKSFLPALLTVREAAEYTGISEWGIRARVAKRQLPVVKLGRSVYINREKLDKLIEEKTFQISNGGGR
ncbi:MAG TPA: helix-turn-helix domain-containing protein [Thermodesulfobacteriota bacterium]|nr:helix-turn-helix domain-containing protein [Thermodesulfobacteriota bacterium]